MFGGQNSRNCPLICHVKKTLLLDNTITYSITVGIIEATELDLTLRIFIIN